MSYRWHPWRGQQVVVLGESRRGNMVVLQCVRDEVPGCRTLEIPEWMFDATVCAPMKSSELPHVDCAILSALKHLLFGYRRLTAMLLREGMLANHKRVCIDCIASKAWR